MTKAARGDTVWLHFTGTLADGSVFDSSHGQPPLQVALGAGQILPALEAAIEGMAAGDARTVVLPAARAHGPYRPEARQGVPRAQIPAHVALAIGNRLKVHTPDGQALVVTVTAISDEVVVLDANHPLAGRDLTFALQVVGVA